ncbi:MAG TPA: hypothetical protein VGH74_18310 [Planctomycetaceae bacterium]
MLRFRLLFSFIVLAGCAPLLADGKLTYGELTYRDLASPEMAVLIEVDRPIQLIDNPLGRDVWELLRQTAGVQKALASPAADRFRQVGRFIEKSLQVDWKTGISRLTADGILVVVQPTKSAEPAVTVVVTAADEQTLKQFLDAVQVEIRRSADAATSAKGNVAAQADAQNKAVARKAPESETISYRTFAIHRVGNGFFSQVGRQLVASNAQRQLESTLDRLADPAAAPTFDLPASLRQADADGNAPAIRVTANLKLVRQDPKAQAGLQLPSNEPLPPLLLGGYLDLFRRADFAAAGLFVNGPALEARIRLAAGTEGAYTGLRGFFASDAAESAPPVLRPTGTLFSAGWFRDYKKLWDARSELVNSQLVQDLDAANERGRNDGLHVGIADLAAWFGPHFRAVAARQRETVYKRKLDERLPAVALVIGLRDETAVRDRLLNPAEGLLVVALGKVIEEYKKLDYRGAKLTTFRFAENADENDPGKAILYNFNPAYTIVRGQLILGSTAEIVRDLIDELERPSPPGPVAEPDGVRTTDRQYISLAELGEFLKGYKDRFERDSMQQRGLSPAAAAMEFEILQQLLKRLGNLTTTHLTAPDHFDVIVRIGAGG